MKTKKSMAEYGRQQEKKRNAEKDKTVCVGKMGSVLDAAFTAYKAGK